MKAKGLLFFMVGIAVAGVVAYRHLGDRGRLTTEPAFDGLTRSVVDNKIVSSRDPTVILRFDPSFQYLGGQKFVLYGVANAEQHFFAEVDADGVLAALFWVQFEEYLPDNSYQYDYEDSPQRLQLNAIEFYVDTAPVKPDPKNRRPGSDGSLARQFVQGKGFSYPDAFAYARLVHLTDASRRKELMIIFIDGPALRGLDPADLEENGRHAESWPAIENELLEKIRRSLKLIAEPGE